MEINLRDCALSFSRLVTIGDEGDIDSSLQSFLLIGSIGDCRVYIEDDVNNLSLITEDDIDEEGWLTFTAGDLLRDGNVRNCLRGKIKIVPTPNVKRVILVSDGAWEYMTIICKTGQLFQKDLKI